MFRKYLLFTVILIFYIPTLSGQESLGDAARRLKAQKNGAQPPSATSSPAAPASSTPSSHQPQASAPAGTAQPAAPSAVSTSTALVPDLNPNVTADVLGLDKYKAAIRQLFEQEKFAEIDRMAHEARSTKARFPGGYWKVHNLYFGISEPAAGMNAGEAEWARHFARLEKWKQQFPDSITARVALAESYNTYGWKARGGDYADKVTDEGWQLLAERAAKARTILEDAKTLAEKCPEWFAAMLTVARTEDSDDLGTVFQQAVAFEPDFYYFYRMMADQLLPKWGGEEGDSARFAESVADHIGGKKGDVIYYEIATTIICACDNEHGLNGMSWPRIKSGYQALTELYGTSVSHMNEMAMMSFRAGEFDYSASLFDQIGADWDPIVWRSPQTFATFKFQAAVPRMKRSLAAARENMQTPEGKLFISALTTDLETRYHQKLMECMKSVSDFTQPSVGLLMELTKDGAVRDVMFAPDNAPGACFRPLLEKATLPTPPKADYWVIVQMTVKDTVTVGAK
jgi:hypothetical protein